MTSIAIIGTGAIGGYYGGLVARAGHAVHFLLNSDVIPKNIASTEALVKAIAANKTATNLFRDSMVFTKVMPKKE